MNQRIMASLQLVLLAAMKIDLREFRQAVLAPRLYAALLLPRPEASPPQPDDAFLPPLDALVPLRHCAGALLPPCESPPLGGVSLPQSFVAAASLSRNW